MAKSFDSRLVWNPIDGNRWNGKGWLRAKLRRSKVWSIQVILDFVGLLAGVCVFGMSLNEHTVARTSSKKIRKERSEINKINSTGLFLLSSACVCVCITLSCLEIVVAILNGNQSLDRLHPFHFGMSVVFEILHRRSTASDDVHHLYLIVTLSYSVCLPSYDMFRPQVNHFEQVVVFISGWRSFLSKVDPIFRQTNSSLSPSNGFK